MEPIIAAGAYTGTAEKDRVKYDNGEGDVPCPFIEFHLYGRLEPETRLRDSMSRFPYYSRVPAGE